MIKVKASDCPRLKDGEFILFADDLGWPPQVGDPDPQIEFEMADGTVYVLDYEILEMNYYHLDSGGGRWLEVWLHPDGHQDEEWATWIQANQ